MSPPPFPVAEPTETRVGIGYDCHRLAAGRRLVLGGIGINAEKGLLGHSDGDILLHAITDAMLGAATQGDIGELFPPTDPQWEGADSSVFLRHAAELLTGYGWRVVNVDAVVIIERPKLLPYRDRIRQNIASLLGIEASAVGLKAKTGEGVGPVGSGELAEAHAVVLIARQEAPRVM